MRTAQALARACHPAPTVAVTVLSGLLAIAAGHGLGRVALIGGAVFTGQLTVGWSNDLIDAARDRAVGRRDKPLATGALSVGAIRSALVLAVLACSALSLAVGLPAGVAHLVLVGWAWTYNLGLKGTVWSWVPYSVAFGGLPAVIWLALEPPRLPPGWMMAVGALLGAGAHLLNALPDLADDAATGVRGLPHRLGERRASVLAVAVLLAATAMVVLAPAGTPPRWSWLVMAVSGLVALAALVRGGRAPFHAAMVIALLNVALLFARS